MPDGVNHDSVSRDGTGAVRVGAREFDWRRGRARSLTRIALMVALAAFLSGCGGDKPEATAGPTLSEEALKQKCANQQWRDRNLGIWYAVCRQPATW